MSNYDLMLAWVAYTAYLQGPPLLPSIYLNINTEK